MNVSSPDVKSIFGRAMEIASPAARAAYLDDACGVDAGLRAEVEVLISYHGRAGEFMGEPVAGDATEDYEPITERPGTMIGTYKLMEQIGEGGMGLVFVAEQQHPMRRGVALKIIKPGMDSRDVIARFEAERQALALMDHPNIARVLDAGTTDSGRPYFVMELVKGIPIVEYCDQQQLTTRERLDLFVSVCQAVQHAHGKGIIHRDLKPSNILVAAHDGEPVVKVIDFGVAKAIGQQLTERTVYTRFAQMIGTPLYLSPEQAEINALDADVRRFLAEEPIEARPPSTWYRLGKLARRHKVALTTSGLVAAALLLGTALSVWQAVRARHAERIALDAGRTALEAQRAAVGQRDEANARRTEAEAARENLRRTLYAADMGLVQAAWEGGRHREVTRLLEREKSENPDLLGFEWDYWMRQSHQAARTISLPSGSSTYFAAFSGDGSRFVANSQRVPVKIKGRRLQFRVVDWKVWDVTLWELDSGREVATFPTAGSVDMVALCFSPDGATLAGVAAYPSGDIQHIWDVGTARSRFSIPLRSQGLRTSAAFSPDGRRVACVLNDLQVGVWDVAQGKQLASYQDDIGAVNVIAFGRGGRELLAIDPHGTVKIWDAADDPGSRLLDAEGRVGSLAVSPDARWIACVVRPDGPTPWNSTPVVKVWDAAGRMVRSFGTPSPAADGEVWHGSLSWSPRGDRIVFAVDCMILSTSSKGESTVAGGALTVWDLDGKELFHLDEKGVGFGKVSLGPDGARVAAVRARGTLKHPTVDPGQYEAKIWDITTGRLMTTIPDCTDAVLDPQGRRLAGFARLPDRSWRALVWDAETGKELTRLELLDPGSVPYAESLAFSPDGQRLAASLVLRGPIGSDKTPWLGLAVWDVVSGKLGQLIPARSGTVVFSPDGSRIACLYGSGLSSAPVPTEIGLLDAWTGRQMLALKGHGLNTTSWYGGIAFSPDGHRILSAVGRNPFANGPGKQAEIRLWDATPRTAAP